MQPLIQHEYQPRSWKEKKEKKEKGKKKKRETSQMRNETKMGKKKTPV